MSETILVVNAGSSRIKFQLFSLEARGQLQRLLAVLRAQRNAA